MVSRSGPFKQSVELDSSRVYILPTRIGLIYSLLLLLLLLGSINYTKSLGFMLTFLLASLGIVAMLTTWRNLAGLRLSRAGATPVFVGQVAHFGVQLENSGNGQRYAIAIENQGEEGEVVDVQQDGLALIRFRYKTQQRGYHDPKRFRLSTEFPLGLFVAWTWIDLSMRCLVYPKPAKNAAPIQSTDGETGENPATGHGMEDFAGLRKYQPGDSWRKVSWKVAARSDELYCKEFTGSQPQPQWIDWYEQKEPRLEQRLSNMTRMILDAQQEGLHYGIRLPGLEIPPSNGAQHRHQCLKALAEYHLDTAENGRDAH